MFSALQRFWTRNYAATAQRPSDGVNPPSPAPLALLLLLSVSSEMDLEAAGRADGLRALGCAICLAALSSTCVRTPCGHTYHEACLKAYYFSVAGEQAGRVRCPLCRSPIEMPLPADARSASGRAIDVVPCPASGQRCHHDRDYRFISLGDFAKRPNILFVLSSNEDRKTAASRVMWYLEIKVPRATVHLNFRSDHHAAAAREWLTSAEHGWVRDPNFDGTISSGIPNGPYHGPVYSKVCEEGVVELFGSATWEGTYFVFVELHAAPPADPIAAAAAATIQQAARGVQVQTTPATVTRPPCGISHASESASSHSGIYASDDEDELGLRAGVCARRGGGACARLDRAARVIQEAAASELLGSVGGRAAGLLRRRGASAALIVPL